MCEVYFGFDPSHLGRGVEGRAAQVRQTAAQVRQTVVLQEARGAQVDELDPLQLRRAPVGGAQRA